jgi:hypothetical protein
MCSDPDRRPVSGWRSRLDAGADVAQHLVNPGALDHLDHGKSSLFGKYSILGFILLGKGKDLLGGKTFIGAHLKRRSAKLLLVTLEQS